MALNNKINKIITLDDNSKIIIIDQGNYKGKAYFLVAELDDSENVTDNYMIVEEVVEENNTVIKSIDDEKLLKALSEYFQKRMEK